MTILRVLKKNAFKKILYPQDCYSVFDFKVVQFKGLKILCDSLKFIVWGYFPPLSPHQWDFFYILQFFKISK